ncbi:MAG: isoprenylcysteine carboxylmethyltransferase family protein [Xenococcaceae cyanobacterium]
MNNQRKTISLLVVVPMLFFVAVIPFLPLLISWHWDWWEAWLFAIISLLGFVISRMLIARHPDLLAERVRWMQHENTKSWDKLLAPLVGLGLGLIPLVAGLDELFDWSPRFSLPAKIVSLVIILAGYALGLYALSENRFFSGVVRIQIDRGHQVVSSGPYRWIRHPGYAGILLAYLPTPMFLDAYWAFLPVIFFTIVLVIRTELEDRTLQDELEGYRDYARRVRYRLLPGVW